MTYSEKLKDPRWQKKRLEIFERDHFTCQECSASSESLNVHHRYYTPKADPWDYAYEALVTLCEACHKRRTEFDVRIAQYFGQMSFSSLAELVSLFDYYQLWQEFGKRANNDIPNPELALRCALLNLRLTWESWMDPETALLMLSLSNARLDGTRIAFKILNQSEPCLTAS